MKTIIVDTNVALRYLAKDVPEQTILARKRLQEAAQGHFHLRMLNTTLVEVMYQLEHWYDLSRKDAAEKALKIVSPTWIELGHKEAVIETLKLYPNYSIDFVDLLTWCIAKHEAAQVLSFDKHFDKLTPRLRLAP